MNGEQKRLSLTATRRPNAEAIIDLSKRRAWYEGEGAAGQSGQGEGQGTGTPPGQQGGEQKPTPIQMTSEQLAERLSRAEESALNKLFEKLNVKNADELATVLTEGQAARDAEEKRKLDEMTEAQRLQTQIDKLTKEKADLEKQLTDTQAQRRIDARNAAVLDAAKEAVNPKDVLRWAEAEMRDALDNVLGEDGAVDDKGVKAIVEAARKANPHYFQAPRPGSPSNRGGNASPSLTKVKEDARVSLRKQIRGGF